MMLRQIFAAVLVATCCSATANAQTEEPVTLSFLDNEEGAVSDQELQRFLEGRLAGSELPFSVLTIRDYDRNVECSTLKHRTIATLNAAGYLRCRAATGDGLIPLFFVEKNGEGTPLYTAAFVVGAGSSIDSLESPEIDRLLLGNPSSTSSYAAPLHYLWKSDLISQPTAAAAAVRKWKVDTLTDAGSIRLALGRDPAAIGSIGLPGTMQVPAGIKVLHRYYVLPQDVLFISKDLEGDQREIESWLLAALRDPVGKDLIARHASAITGLVPFGDYDEGQRALKTVEKMQSAIARVNGGASPSRDLDLPAWIAVFTGLVLIGLGIFFFNRPSHAGSNSVNLLGIEISVSHAPLMLVLVGVVVTLIGLGFLKLPGGS